MAAQHGGSLHLGNAMSLLLCNAIGIGREVLSQLDKEQAALHSMGGEGSGVGLLLQVGSDHSSPASREAAFLAAGLLCGNWAPQLWDNPQNNTVVSDRVLHNGRSST